MALFGNKKKDEEKDVAEIKNTANTSNQEIPAFNNPFANEPANQTNNQEQTIQQQPNFEQNPLNTQTLSQQPISAQPQPTFNTQPTNNSLSEERVQELIEETVEKVIDERWEQISANIDKIIRWRDKIEGQITTFKEDINIIRDDFENAQKKLSNKISQYDVNIMDVNSEIKALEKVFQKITPTLINNVNELQKIAQDLKGIKPSQESKKPKES